MKDKILKIRDEKIFEQCITDLLKKWFLYIGVEIQEADTFVTRFKDAFLSNANIYEVEKNLNTLIGDMHINTSVEKRLRIEEDLVYSEIKPFLIAGNALDIGTGSGRIAQKINAGGFTTSVIDVIDFNQSNLPLTIYDGKTIPFPDDKFTNVTLLTVLHHCDSYKDVLSEAIRVSQKNIIIIESVFTNQNEYYANMFFDWLWNRVVYQDVNVPFNFHTPEDWTNLFKDKGLIIDKSLDLGYDSPMTPEHHWLFVLKKN